MNAWSYETATDFLYGLQRVGIKFGLENITRVLACLGNPQERIPSVHIAGSNGKGSTAAHLESILMHAGFRVGLYTSPHFVRFTERIRVQRSEISEVDMARWTQAILQAVPELTSPGHPDGVLPITFFEFTTAMAMAYFAQQEVDVAILETGMGGRLDATNVCRPRVSVITTISLEHQDYLGTTLAAIAREKAGIIKPGVPVVSGVGHPRARETVEGEARERGAPIYRLGREFQVRGEPGAFTYQGLRLTLHGLATGLRGRHQLRNAAVALAAAELLQEQGYGILQGAMRQGVSEVRWRGRQQWLPGPPQVLLDGAHNPEAIRTLCASLRHDYGFEKLRVLMGIMNDKDHVRMIRSLSPLAHEFVFSRPRMDRSQDPWVLREVASGLGSHATVVESVVQGFQDLLKRSAKEDLVCVTGSLFAVGEILAHLEKNDLQAGRGLA
jgi:dihydrofolate synthase/folylpolyglutamate synthase